MKFFILILLSTSLAHAQINWTQKLLFQLQKDQKIVDVLSTQLLMHRCLRSAPAIFPSHKMLESCLGYSTKFLKILDKSSMKIQSSPKTAKYFTVVFKAELLNLLEHPLFESYIQDLLRQRDLSLLLQKDKVPLFQLTQKWFSREKRSLSVMAVLFQDTSQIKAHLSWLASVPMNSKQVRNFELISDFFDRFLVDLTSRKVRYEFLDEQALSLGVQEHQTYHYYVPALAAQKLVEQGVPIWAAVLIPYQFNYIYEILTSRNGMKSLFIDAEQILNEHAISDIYAAYLGSCRGAGVKNGFLNFENFKNRMKVENRILQKEILKSLEIFPELGKL